MLSALGSEAFAEEKDLLLREGAALRRIFWLEKQPPEVRQRREDFCSAFARASPELRSDREAALAAVAVSGFLLKHCSETLRNDVQVATAAVSNLPEAFAEVGQELRGDRSFVLAAVQDHGCDLCHAQEDLRNDRDLVLEIVATDGVALADASAELRGDRDVVLAALESYGCALEYASEALRSEREVVLAALERDAGALESASEELKNDAEIVSRALLHETCESQAWGHAGAEAKRNEDLLLLAVRSGARFGRGMGYYNQASEELKVSLSWETVKAAADSSLACPGESSPILAVTLAWEPCGMDQAGSSRPGRFRADIILMSGSHFSLYLGEPKNRTGASILSLDLGARRESDQRPVHADAGPAPSVSSCASSVPTASLVVNDLAIAAVGELPQWTKVKTPDRVFIVFELGEDRSVPATPWDWHRPLRDFVKGA